ncbi:hypothetical protein QNO07_19240 [Streptomyces sp. 549]|uniref:hypothetical protein n=1 Tax=Streptomyces sp. 549 TaxID=3049076 RepID=UPI0024C255D9|nr:hypothetical protein [Streptomyces sp. 549]MDK1475525.1 hypothetical protein [Streptomyces sp. 549]
MTKSAPSSTPVRDEPETLAELRLDCARMAARWTADGPSGTRPAPAGWSQLHGVRVPDRSARLLDGMSDYGD